MLKFNNDELEFLMDGTSYNRSFKAFLSCTPEISIEIVDTQHEIVKQYPAIKARFKNIFPLYEDVFDNFFVFVSKDNNGNSQLLVAKPDNYLLGFTKYRVLIYPQDVYGYGNNDITEEIIEGGNEKVYKVLQAIIAEHSLNMEVTV